MVSMWQALGSASVQLARAPSRWVLFGPGMAGLGCRGRAGGGGWFCFWSKPKDDQFRELPYSRLVSPGERYGVSAKIGSGVVWSSNQGGFQGVASLGISPGLLFGVLTLAWVS